MLLPRGEKERGQPEVGPGFYPPMMHQLTLPEGPEQWEVDKSYSMTHSVEAMAKLQSTRRGKKYNLMAQVIPIYGFGILLYILYIMYKLTCKEKTTKPGSHSSLTKANTDKTTTEYELARLQEELLKTQRLVDRMVSGKGHGTGSGRRSKNKTRSSKKEEKLLKQLRQITLLMQESRLEGASPEMEAEEVPYGVDWEGYPEETYPEHDEPCRRHDACTIMMEEASNQLTAEALAERMEQDEEDIVARKLDIVQEEDEEQAEEEEEVEVEVEDGDEEEDTNEEEEEEEKQQLLAPSSHAEQTQEWVGLEVSRELQAQSGGKKQITFSEHKYIYHYPKEETFEEEEEEEWMEKEDEEEDEEEENDEEEEEVEEDEEDDPVMEAERLKFNSEICLNPEDEAEDECVFLSLPAEGPLHSDISKQVEVSGLRMRNRRET